MYSPRVNLVELGDEMTISVGTHLGLGLLISAEDGNSFALDLPIVAELNFGHAAHPNTSSSFGGFVGAGYGTSRIGSDGAFGADYNRASGVVFNAGTRGHIRQSIPLGLRVSYLLNTKKDFDNVISVGLFYTFGKF